ncbi:MAG: 4-(cytidine 5'-diphospho)-2-C-methyl-D-erythritol kinase [Rhizobiaceae bacterium]|nr:4-(cytidine 5'-diphospho)-2-C-methyl-D-erythritol kinase [Rhizobiaceae bacterium]
MPDRTLPVVEDAPAKINLALHVTGKRPDGYHLLETLVVFTRLGDRLTATCAARDDLEITGRYATGLPVDYSNLVIRARDAFRAWSPSGPVRLSLEKNLPIASGIGGGSSDAAATLRALARLEGEEGRDFAAIGGSLGADVPMCLVLRPLIARGIGEVLEPVSGLPELALVLVNPGVHVSTPDVFRGLPHADNPALAPLPEKLDFTSLVAWLRASRNDLQMPAERLAPSIGEALAALEGTNPAFARMSGSGATCFGIYENVAEAERAAQLMRAARPDWFIAATSTLP